MIVDLETRDFDELAELQERWDLDYRPLSRGTFQASLRVNRWGPLQLDLEFWSRPLEILGQAPSDMLAIVLPTGAGSRYLSRGLEIGFGCLEGYRPGAEIHAVTQSEAGLAALSVDLEELLVQGSALACRDLEPSLAQHWVMRGEPGALGPLRECYRTLSELAGAPPGGPLTSAPQRWLDSHAIEALVATIPGASAARERPLHRYALARSARDRMLSALDSPPTLSEVCRDLRVSQRTPLYAFRDVYGTTPKAYLKAQRLLAAHRALKQAPAGTSITLVMMDLGFFDAGHFARDYRGMFGERPSDTLHGR